MTGETWDRRLGARQPMEALVAELDGGVAGFAHLPFRSSTRLAGRACRLRDPFVGKARRGRGRGRALIAAAGHPARGGCAARLARPEDNRDAIRLRDRPARRTGRLPSRRDP